MASNLVKRLKPAKLVVLDVNRQAVDRFAKEASKWTEGTTVSTAKTPRQVAQQCSVIITMLPTPSHVKSVYLEGPDSILAGLSGRPLLIDSSTIDPSTSQFVADSVRRKIPDALVVDAPVSGGTVGAEAGTLTFMVGSNCLLIMLLMLLMLLLGRCW